MNILYLGANSGTSRQKAQAMRRVGFGVDVIDPSDFLPKGKLVRHWVFKTGSLFLDGFVTRGVLRSVEGKRYDLVWVDSGELVSSHLVRALQARFGPVVNYNHDDPFGTRDGWRWRLYLECVPVYDLLIVVRDCNVAEARALGARGVELIFRTADEVAHAPRVISEREAEAWRSDVLFAGTWMPERGPFMMKLIEAGVPLAIYGNGWQAAPEWPSLMPYWRGPAVDDPEDYARAVQSAKICLGLLSKGNRDLHTTRSMEIPHLGGLLLAERTDEHLALYKEGEEAEFWSDVEECTEKCMALLADDDRRARIAAAGHARCLANRHLNEVMLGGILRRFGWPNP